MSEIQESAEGDALVVRHRKLPLVFFTLLSVIGVIGCASLLNSVRLDPLQRNAGQMVLAGWVGIPIFAISTLVMLWRLLNPKPAFLLTPAGFQDISLLHLKCFIRWEEMADAFLWTQEVQNQHYDYICLTLREPEQFIGKFKGMTQRLLRSRTEKYGATILISMNGLSESAETLLPLMKNRIAEAELTHLGGKTV